MCSCGWSSSRGDHIAITPPVEDLAATGKQADHCQFYAVYNEHVPKIGKGHLIRCRLAVSEARLALQSCRITNTGRAKNNMARANSHRDGGFAREKR